MRFQKEPQDQPYNFSPMAEEGRSIQWRVEAFDTDGLGSGQTKPWSFSFITAAPTQADESGCDCRSFNSDRERSILLLFCLLVFYRPRRK